MFRLIEDILTNAEIAELHRIADGAKFVDGRISNPHSQVKNNLHLGRSNAVMAQLQGDVVLHVDLDRDEEDVADLLADPLELVEIGLHDLAPQLEDEFIFQRVVPDGYGPEHVNVADQKRDPDSLWNFMATLIRRYRECR